MSFQFGARRTAQVFSPAIRRALFLAVLAALLSMFVFGESGRMAQRAGIASMERVMYLGGRRPHGVYHVVLKNHHNYYLFWPAGYPINISVVGPVRDKGGRYVVHSAVDSTIPLGQQKYAYRVGGSITIRGYSSGFNIASEWVGIKGGWQRSFLISGGTATISNGGPIPFGMKSYVMMMYSFNRYPMYWREFGPGGERKNFDAHHNQVYWYALNDEPGSSCPYFDNPVPLDCPDPIDNTPVQPPPFDMSLIKNIPVPPQHP